MSRRVRVMIAAGAAVVVGAGVGIAAVHATHDPFVSQVTYSDDISGIVVSADGRTVSAVVPHGEPDGTLVDSTEDLVATETASTVVVRIRHRTVEQRRNCCPGVAAQFGALTVTLAAPVNGRAVVVGDSGRTVPVIDGRTLLTVPAGSPWRLAMTTPVAVSPGVLAGAVEDFEPLRSGSTFSVELTETSTPSDAVTGNTVEVRGVKGVADGNILAWSADGKAFRIQAYVGGATSPPTTQQIIAFADALI